jgi:ribonuclease Z
VAQEEKSVFVELGSGEKFIFDCGSGVAAKYEAMEIPYSSMDKIFLTHLHADHSSDLMNIYCFGPANDRKTPLYVWGGCNSGVADPNGNTYDDGLAAFCASLRAYARWHTESFSFQQTGLDPTKYTPPIWAPQNLTDGYDLVPFELDWSKNPGVAYPPGASYDDPPARSAPGQQSVFGTPTASSPARRWRVCHVRAHSSEGARARASPRIR